jgi:hypothetical protein
MQFVLSTFMLTVTDGGGWSERFTLMDYDQAI